jgi:hypothetical protein
VSLFLLKKRGLWWRPDSCGYCDGVLYAGTYSRKEAESICRGSHGEVTMVPLAEAIARVGPFDRIVLEAALAKAEGK